MPLQIVRNDITKMPVDAIVNAANSSLLGGGGVDGAIHAAAGPELLAECRGLGGCYTGEAKITRGYRLPARYVIHTVGPIWHGGGQDEETFLRCCYRNSLELAVAYGCESVAFPLISAGAYGYPKAEALQVAVGEIGKFLMEHDLTVYLVVFDKDSFQVSRKLVNDIREYIDEYYVGTHFREDGTTFLSRARDEGWGRWPEEDGFPQAASPQPFVPSPPALKEKKRKEKKRKEKKPKEPRGPRFGGLMKPGAPRARLEAPISSQPSMPPCPAPQRRPTPPMATVRPDFVVDESFSQMLLRKIDERGMTDAQCYKKANIDRKLFNKIKNDPHYKPSKPTAVAFAVALELDLGETRELLDKAGFSLSHSFQFDLIIEYFIRQGNYDVFQINELLFEFDQVLLGA